MLKINIMSNHNSKIQGRHKKLFLGLLQASRVIKNFQRLKPLKLALLQFSQFLGCTTLAAPCARMFFRRRASSCKALRRLFIVAAGLLLTCAFVVVTAICYAEIEGLIVVTQLQQQQRTWRSFKLSKRGATLYVHLPQHVTT